MPSQTHESESSSVKMSSRTHEKRTPLSSLFRAHELPSASHEMSLRVNDSESRQVKCRSGCMNCNPHQVKCHSGRMNRNPRQVKCLRMHMNRKLRQVKCLPGHMNRNPRQAKCLPGRMNRNPLQVKCLPGHTNRKHRCALACKKIISLLRSL